MICPACKSNNIDTAKFCGGCGTPLQASAKAADPEPPSAMDSCAQGHVYSSVYNACPYCPQEDRPSAADFATRIEPVGGNDDMQTRVEPVPTVVQPAVSKPAPATMIEPPTEQNRTGPVRRDYATVIDPGESESSSSGLLPDAQATQIAPPRTPATVVEPPTPPAPPVRTGEHRAAPPPAARGAQPQRRTVVVPNEDASTRGRLIGWLVSFSQNADGQDYRLRGGRNIIGANPSCDIVLEDEAVSGVHASIVFRNGRCFLKDELSSNGTFLNSVEITEPEQLQSYDQIRVGNVLLTFISLDLSS